MSEKKGDPRVRTSAIVLRESRGFQPIFYGRFREFFAIQHPETARFPDSVAPKIRIDRKFRPIRIAILRKVEFFSMGCDSSTDVLAFLAAFRPGHPRTSRPSDRPRTSRSDAIVGSDPVRPASPTEPKPARSRVCRRDRRDRVLRSPLAADGRRSRSRQIFRDRRDLKNSQLIPNCLEIRSKLGSILKFRNRSPPDLRKI